MERTRHRGLEIVLGLLLSAVLVGAVLLIWESFSGAFSNKITVAAQLTQAGDALEQGDIVTYRNVIVGEVASATGDVHGGAVAKLQIDPHDAAQIPAAVTAVALPASLFGTTKIELVPAGDTSGPKLRDGDTIAADTSPAATGLQTALAKAYDLLTAIHPAQLDAALSALADALQGQGEHLGTLIVTADNYLERLAPQLPELNDVITSLATVTGELAKNAPDLLVSLRNTLVIAKGILASKQAVANLLAVAPSALDNALRLASNTNIDNAVTIFHNEVPVSQALAEHPEALADTIHGFKAFADTFAQVIHGSSGQAVITLTGINWAQLGPLLLTGQGHMLDNLANPAPYTAADCPRYPGAAGPNCDSTAGPSDANARLLTTGSGWGGTVGSAGSAPEIATVNDAAQTLTGNRNADPAVTDLLLGPVLRGTVTVTP